MIVVNGNTFRFPGLAEDATARAGTFKLDATKNPNEMDSTSDEKEVSLGIYEFEPDSYNVCFAPPARHVPPTSVPSPAVVRSSSSGNGKRITKAKRSPLLFS